MVRIGTRAGPDFQRRRLLRLARLVVIGRPDTATRGDGDKRFGRQSGFSFYPLRALKDAACGPGTLASGYYTGLGKMHFVTRRPSATSGTAEPLHRPSHLGASGDSAELGPGPSSGH